jgi:hypothetical protein
MTQACAEDYKYALERDASVSASQQASKRRSRAARMSRVDVLTQSAGATGSGAWESGAATPGSVTSDARMVAHSCNGPLLQGGASVSGYCGGSAFQRDGGCWDAASASANHSPTRNPRGDLCQQTHSTSLQEAQLHAVVHRLATYTCQPGISKRNVVGKVEDPGACVPTIVGMLTDSIAANHNPMEVLAAAACHTF